MMTKTLRDYQEQCVRLTVQAIEGRTERGFHYVLPTGTGKTEVAQAIIETFAESGRILCIAHTRELIHQTAKRLRGSLSDVGVCMAEENEINSRVVVGSVQTLTRGRFRMWLECDLRPSLVWVDECHHVTQKNRYGALLKELWESFPDVPVVGCTATDFRTDGDLFQELLPVCTFRRTIAEMQKGLWLAPTIWRPVTLPVNLNSVGKSRRSNGESDYQDEELAAALLPHTDQVVKKTVPMLEDRKTVVFGATVKHAQELAERYNDHGVVSVCIWGDMPREQRRNHLEAWKEGCVQLAANVGVFTEGFDFPDIAAMVCVSPTMSPVLYLQRLGRCTRLKPGQYKDALIIDVCGNTNLLQTNQVTLPKVQGCIIPDTGDMETSEMIDALEEEEKQGASVPHAARPRSVVLGAWENVSWARWGWDRETNCYYLKFGVSGEFREYYVAVLPDPKGSGLWYPFMFTHLGKWKREKIVDFPIKLNQVMQHVNHLILQAGMKKELNKQASWQMEPASDKQIWLLGQLDREAAIQARASYWTKGEVSLAITWAKLKPAIFRTLGRI